MLVTVVALAGAGAVFGGQLAKWLRQQSGAGSGRLDLDRPEIIGLIVVLLLTLHLMLLAHELGHLIGGRLVGFRAFLLIVGPIRLERGDAGWHLHMNRSAALWGGLAGSTPTNGANLRLRSAVMIAAGPLTSLVVGLGGLSLWWVRHPAGLGATTPYVDVVLLFTLLCGGAASLTIGIATLLPLRTTGFLSDGARLLRLLQNGPVARRDMALQSIIAQSLAGQRPRDWSRALIDEALSVRDGTPFEFTAWQLAQFHALDNGRAAEAMEWLARVVAGINLLTPALRPGVRYEAARQLALHGDIPAAQAQLDAATGQAIGAPFAQALAQATLLAMTGRRQEALAMLPTIKGQIAGSIDRGGGKLLLDAVADLENRHHDDGTTI